VRWNWAWHIDTAQYYGPDVANELIREALHPYPGTLALVSKVGARRDASGGWLPYDEPDELRRGIEDNLRSLGVGQLAAVNLRVIEGAVPDRRFDAQLGAMIRAREEGLIGGVGFSAISRGHLLRALDQTPIACVQNPLNPTPRLADWLAADPARVNSLWRYRRSRVTKPRRGTADGDRSNNVSRSKIMRRSSRAARR
jgi:aryl-alcohol dehydrogenase-like predicted oxidoreductase